MAACFWADGTMAAATVRQRFPALAQQTLQLADEVCQNSFTFRGHWEMERTHTPVVYKEAIRWDHVENEDPEWTYAFNRHSFFVTLGQAWQLTGNQRYVECFSRLATDWINNVPLTAESRATTWRSIEAGLRCESWLRALCLFGEATPPALREAMEKSLLQHGEYLMETHAEFQVLSNWGVLQDHGLYLLGRWFGNSGWANTALARLDEQLAVQVFADGTHWEQSPLYHCEVLHCCLSTLLAARRSGDTPPETMRGKVHDMCVALAQLLRPDGRMVCQSDSDDIDARDLLALGSILFADGTLKAYAGDTLWEENLWDFADWEAEFAALPSLPRQGSVYLAHSGNAMLWDGHGNDAGFLHMHCGCLGSGHGHADLLHVDLFSHGETILADSGRYTYRDIPLRRLFKSARGHNTLLVDDEEFSVPQGAWGYSKIAEPLKGSFFTRPEASYADGAHLGYMHLGVLPRRRVLCLGGGIWLMWDSFTCANDAPHVYEHLFHFGHTGRVEAQPGAASFTGKHCTASFAFAASGTLDMRLEPCQISREYNLLEDSSRLALRHSGASFGWMVSAIAIGDTLPALGLQMLPVTLASSGRALAPWQAQAAQVTVNGACYTVIVSHNETIAEVERLQAGEYKGYGKVLLFSPQQPQGVCLAW